MNPKKRVITTLLGGVPDRIPVSCVTQLAIKDTMAAVDAYFPEAHSNADKMAKLGSALWELAGLEVTRVPFCLTVLAEALGCGVEFGNEERTPSIYKHLPSVDKIEIPDDFLERGRIPIVKESVNILRSKVGDVLPIIVGMEGPFTLAGHLFGTGELLSSCLTNPEKVKELVNVTTEAVIEYSRYMVRAGADIILIAEPTASPNLIAPEMFKSIVKSKLIEVGESMGGITILHICGDVSEILKDMSECGFNGLSIEETVDVLKARYIVGEDTVLIGNISASNTLPFKTPDVVESEVHTALEKGIDILAPGCGLPTITPIQNIVTLVQTVKEWGPEPPRKKAVVTEGLSIDMAKEIGYGIGEAVSEIVFRKRDSA